MVRRQAGLPGDAPIEREVRIEICCRNAMEALAACNCASAAAMSGRRCTSSDGNAREFTLKRHLSQIEVPRRQSAGAAPTRMPTHLETHPVAAVGREQRPVVVGLTLRAEYVHPRDRTCGVRCTYESPACVTSCTGHSSSSLSERSVSNHVRMTSDAATHTCSERAGAVSR